MTHGRDAAYYQQIKRKVETDERSAEWSGTERTRNKNKNRIRCD